MRDIINKHLFPFKFNNKMITYLLVMLMTGKYLNVGQFLEFYYKKSINFVFYVNKKKIVNYYLFKLLTSTVYKNKLNSQMLEIKNKFDEESNNNEKPYKELIQHTLVKNDTKSKQLQTFKNLLGSLKDKDLDIQCSDKISGAIYNKPEHEEMELVTECLKSYYKTNPLHSDIYPSLIVMEKQVVNFVKQMFNLDTNVGGGTLTTGGTESIILALFGYREYAKSNKNISNPEIVALRTVHPAFDKGCHYLGIKLNKIDIDDDNNLNKHMFNSCINHNTIAIVGSTPSFPHGLVDDIEYMCSVAKKRNIPVHVDACLGGFVMPFITTNHTFDFSVDGVTSVSVDTHKYGCSPKGSSVLLFRDKEILSHCYFIQSSWCGGIYATTNITGSRSGFNLACTWSIMNYLGIETYKNQAKTIQSAVNKIKLQFKNDSDIFIFGDPSVCVVAFGSKTLDIYSVSQEMKQLGWNLNELQNPPSFHFCITNRHTPKLIDQFILDLQNTLSKLVSNNEFNTNIDQCGSIYGTTQRVPDQSCVDQAAKFFLNSLH